MSTIVAPNMLNRLEVVKPLRLMPSRGAAITVKQSWGIHRVQVPSNLGGALVIGLGIDDLAPPPGTPQWRDGIDFKVMDPKGRIHAMEDPFKPLRLEIPAGHRGNGVFFIYMNAPSGRYQLYARFVDIGQARNPDGTPFIPWNFWFFPYSRTTEAGPDATAWASSKLEPLAKYEKAFDNPGSLDWERQFHSDLHHPREDWEGHCDDAAPASVLFDAPPKEGLTHNGVHFSCEELKLLATEVAAQYKEPVAKWFINDAYTKTGPFHDRKPSDAPKDFGAIEAQGIAELLGALRTTVRDQGTPVVMDLRDASGSKANEVWNHAVFRYVTHYWQNDVHDPHLIEGKTSLFANADHIPADLSCSGFPATVARHSSSTSVRIGSTAEARQLFYRLRFTAKGGIDRDSAEQRWYKVTTKALGGEVLLHAPRHVSTFTALRLEPYPSTPDGGNPLVFLEDVLELLTLRRQS